MKAYLAGQIFSPADIAIMAQMEQVVQDLGFQTFNPYAASRPIWQGRSPAQCSPEERKQVVDQNVENLLTSDLLVAWMNRGGDYGGRTDTGVVWEMGYFARDRDHVNILSGIHSGSYRKQIIGFIDPSTEMPRAGVNLMLTGTVDAMVRGLDQLAAAARMYLLSDYRSLRALYSPHRGKFQEQGAMER